MDIALLLLLILINGFFSMAEMALVSSRKARLQRLADEGGPGAQTALSLHNEPSSFLSAIQVGITSIGILSGAIGETALADPLAEWLDSIAHLRAELPDTLLVLPAHGAPFRGLHARLERLAQGHARGLERLRRALAEPRRVVDVFGSLFARAIDPQTRQLGLATGETVAHLNHLLARGEIERTEDADGVWRYRAVG